MVCVGTAVLLHVQKFWMISAESNDLLALAQRFGWRDGAKLALDQRFHGLAVLSWPCIGVLDGLTATT